MKAAFVTLGCKVNQYESNALEQLLRENGFTVVSAKDDADVYIVNSCTVTAESSRKSRQALRRMRQTHPQAVIVLTGCYAQAYSDALASLPEADIVLGTKQNRQLPNIILDYVQQRQRIVCVAPHEKTDTYDCVGAASFEGHTRAFIKIQDGCNRRCTYCIIPKSRGFSRSRSPEEIKQELNAIAENGYKEVVFVGINLSAYGLDIQKNICDALLLAQEQPGIERIRLGSLEPDHITDEVIAGLSGMSKFCPQFHLSLQSGSNTILKRMNRHYTAEEYETLCNKLKDAFPALSLTTDIICGFPGETQRDFAETVAFAEKIGFLKVHVFPYSRRVGTPAASYPDQVEKIEKLRRCAILQESCDAVRLRILASAVGSNRNVLFETPKNGLQHGYTENYTPVVVQSEALLTGQIKTVEITGVKDGVCTGILKET